MTPFTTYTGTATGDETLTNALLAPNSGITIYAESIKLHASAQTAVNFYDGTLGPLGIGAGLLLTSGYAPGTTNTVGWDGQDNSGTTGFYNGDAQIDAVVNTVFKTQSYDATTLDFSFSVTDPDATSVSFDLVFGSDEFPEWVDQFVDSAIVMVNGVNYALFNHDPMHPLSVVSSNLAAGYFQDNAGNVLPIEYDGVSHVLKIIAPINPGVPNHIKIGIADTGDHIYDSGIFLANFSAGTIPGSGVVSPSGACDNSNNSVTGSAKDEYFDLLGGDDLVYAGAGDDIVVAGSGNDTVYGGSGADQMKGDSGDDKLDGGDSVDAYGGVQNDTAVYAGLSTDYGVVYDAASSSFTVTDSKTGAASEGTDTLTKVEFAQFGDGLFALGANGLTLVTPVTPPANMAGLVVVSGVGSVGNTLTATVSDANGVPGAPGSIGYQWLLDGTSIGGAVNSTYTVTAGAAGKQITVVASYTDNAGTGETVQSAPKNIVNANTGDLVVTLMQLNAPAGTSIINPLTTLVQDAIALGVSPNAAALSVKSVLGLPAGISLQSYDAYTVLLSNANEATALAVEKVAVQIAILTSLSDDDTGMKLTLKVLEAAAAGQTLDLANVDDLGGILGIDPVLHEVFDPETNTIVMKYDQPLNEIYDRNKSMSDAIDDVLGGGGKPGDTGLSVINAEWLDLLSINDGIASTSIADLSIHVNQAPTGVATATLADGVQGSAYIITAADLLQGYGDPDGGVLEVSGLVADSGDLQANADGTWTFTPTAGFSGPVELSYQVLDGQGGSASASQLFAIAVAPAANTAPTGTATAVLAQGSEDTAYMVLAANLLAGFSDADGDTLSVAELTASDGTVAANGDGSFTITPTANTNGAVNLSYNVVDGNGGAVAATQAYTLAAVNDAPTGAATAALIDGTENAAYSVTASSLLVGFGDIDGDLLVVAGLAADHGTVVDNLDGSYTINPELNYSGAMTLSYDVADGYGGTQAAIQHVNFTALAGMTVTGTANADKLVGGAHDDTLVGLGGNDTLDGSTGNDTLVGGTGSDTYLVDSAADVVTEVPGAGTDTVLASVSYALGNNVEKLTLTGSAAIDAIGSSLANTLTGNSANNLLDGRAGADRMAGGTGNDTYMVDSTGDVVTEGTGAGVDTVVTNLASYTLGSNVEHLTLGELATSGKGNSLGNNISGNNSANVLSGLAGNDMLEGGDGNDMLIGGSGNDILNGGNGADVFRFDKVTLSASTNLDTILDFKPLDDSIELENAIFKKLAVTGILSAGNFRSSADGTAADSNDYILYNTGSGALYYDADGNGSGAAVQFVTLVGQPSITAADFVVT